MTVVYIVMVITDTFFVMVLGFVLNRISKGKFNSNLSEASSS